MTKSTTNLRSLRGLAASLAATALVLAACGGGDDDSDAKGLDTIRLLQAAPSSMSLNVKFVGEELGYFEDEGIKIEEQDAGDLAELAFLDNGQTDLVFTGATEIITGIEAGVEVSVLYEYWQESAEGIFVLEDSPVQSVEDLEGETVGLASDSDLQFLNIALSTVGLDESAVKTIVVGDQGGVVAKALKDGKIAAMSGSTGDQRALAGAGVDIRDVTPDETKATPGQSFIAMTDEVAKNKDLYDRFFRAWAKASHASIQNDDVLIAMGKIHIPEAMLDMVQAKVGLEQSKKAKPVGEFYGQLRPDVWERVAASLLKAGGVKKQVPVADHLDDQFIAPANDFDKAEVDADVAAWAKKNL